jgi:hypothetical protein
MDSLCGKTDGEIGGIFPKFVPRGARHEDNFLHGLLLDSREVPLRFLSNALAFGGRFRSRVLTQILDFHLEILQTLFDTGCLRFGILLYLGSVGQSLLDLFGSSTEQRGDVLSSQVAESAHEN